MKQIQELLAKQMSRREFLQIIGMGILTAIGVGNFLSLLRRQTHSGPSDELGAINNVGVSYNRGRYNK